MILRCLVLAVVMAAFGAPIGTVPVGAEAPMTCLPEVAGADFDATAPFAGRLRPFAASPQDPTVVSRELLCPYLRADGETLSATLAWDERPGGRFACEAGESTITGSGPVRARLDHPTRQAAVLLEAPDQASVQAMGDAARLLLATVPPSAAPCTASSGAPVSAGAVWPVAALAVLAGAGALAVVHRRRRRRRGQGSGAVAAAAGSAARSPSPTASDLVSVLSSDPAGLDVMAAATVAAHVRGRPDLTRVAMAARRTIGDGREPDPAGPRRSVVARVLEVDGHPADGRVEARHATRPRQWNGNEGDDHGD